MRLRWFILTVVSGFLLSCLTPAERGADLYISVRFPQDGELGARFLDPQTSCISVELLSDDGSFYRSAVLSPQNPEASFEDIPVTELTVEIHVTDGDLSGGGCGGSLLDYATARVSLEEGENALELTMPRAEWVFRAPVTLNGTLPDSTERLTGFALFSYPLRSGFPGFDRYSVLFRGSGLNGCRSGSGITCYTQIDYALHLRNGHETVGTVGVEFVPYPDPDSGWVRLSPGTGGERYFVLISSPPCSYRTPANLVSCDMSVSTTLEPYMGVSSDQGSVRGHVWEIMLLSQPTFSKRCFWDRDLTDPFPCPDDLTEPEPTPPYGRAARPLREGVSDAGAAFSGVSANLRKVYRLSSAEYARCDPADVCDYNLDGAIDGGDDTNGDGVIDHRDSREFFAEFSWSMSFDLVTHPFEADPAPLGRLIESHLFIDSDTSAGAPSTLVPVDYDGTVKPPLVSDTALFKFLIWAFGGYDLRTGRYYAYHPRWLIYYDPNAGEYRVVDAITLSPAGALNIGTASLCDFLVLTDPFAGVGHIFYVDAGADSTCGTGDELAFYLNTADNAPLELGSVFFDGASSLLYEPVVFSDRPDRYVTGFLGWDVGSSTVVSCDTAMNCSVLLNNVSSYAPVGFHFGMKRAFFMAVQGDWFLYYYDPVTNTAEREASGTPVTACTLSSDTVYCSYLDPGAYEISVYRFDPESRSLLRISQQPIANADPTYWEEIYTTRDYVIVEYTDSLTWNLVQYALPKGGGVPALIDFAGEEIMLSMSTDEGVYGYLLNTGGGICWASNNDIYTGQCLPEAAFPTDPEGFPQRFPRVNGSFGKNPVEYSATVVVSTECTGLTDCAGGNLYAYTPDMTARSLIAPIVSTYTPEAVYGTEELFLVNFMDVNTFDSFIYTVLTGDPPTMEFSGWSGAAAGIVDELPAVFIP